MSSCTALAAELLDRFSARHSSQILVSEFVDLPLKQRNDVSQRYIKTAALSHGTMKLILSAIREENLAKTLLFSERISTQEF